MSTNHSFWQGYRLPDLKAFMAVTGDEQTIKNCSLVNGNVPTVSKTNVNDDVHIDKKGEYLLLRSNNAPIEVQIGTESCSVSKSGICVCSVTVRNGNDIYTVDFCDDMYREGFLHGNIRGTLVEKNTNNYWSYSGFRTDVYVVHFINGMEADISVDRSSGIVGISISDARSEETFADMDGLCNFETESYRSGMGVYMMTQTGFADSWGITTERSLLNPTNWNDYQWTEEYFVCHCPDASEPFSDREMSYNSTWRTSYNVFKGFIRCGLEHVCSTHFEGLNWEASVLPNYTISNVTIQPMYENGKSAPRMLFQCLFETQTDVLYQIQWMANTDVIYSTNIVASTDAGFNQVYLVELQAVNNQFALETEWRCGVSVHDLQGGILLPTTFSQAFKAIEIESTSVIIPRGGDTTFKINVNMPVRCGSGDCYLDFMVYDEEDDHSCQDSTIAAKNKYTCGNRLSGGSSSGSSPQELEIRLTTKNNDKYSLKSAFTLKIEVDATGEMESFWSGTFSDHLSVIVRDVDTYWKNTYCYATNDPRVKTFDGLYYSVISKSLIDEFVMMRHKDLPVEVQMQTELCNWGWAACGCGVTVRAGRDVFTVTHCHGDHITEYLLVDEGLLDARMRSPNHYQIYLPHGSMVDVYYYRSKWWSTMNIMIYPSPTDMGRVEGLCGNFNGERTDDLIHSDGQVSYLQTSNWWWWWWTWPDPDEFSKSWGLHNTGRNDTSLLNLEYVENNLEFWSSEDNLCVCRTNVLGKRLPHCAKTEYGTCNAGDKKLGVSINKGPRDVRSVSDRYDREDLKLRLDTMRQRRESAMETHKLMKRETNPDAVNYTVAEEICETQLANSCPTVNMDGSLPNGTNITAMISECAQDVMINKSQNWFESSCVAIQGVAETVVSKDVEYQEQNPDIAEEIKTATCIGNCSGHGTCVSVDTCVCDEGFGNTDCSVNLNAVLNPVSIQGNGFCNKGQKACEEIRITTDGCIQGVTCKVDITEIMADGSQSLTSKDAVLTGSCDNGYDVFCSIPSTERRKRSSDATSPVATVVTISVSNNGQAYGSSSNVVILDSTCLDYNSTDGSVLLKDDYCIISGVCYGNGTNNGDPCYYCDDKLDAFDWTLDDMTDNCLPANMDHTGPPVSGSDGLPIYVVAIAAGIPLVILAIAALGAYVYKRQQAKKIALARADVGGLYDKQQNMRFKSRVGPAGETYVENYPTPNPSQMF